LLSQQPLSQLASLVPQSQPPSKEGPDPWIGKKRLLAIGDVSTAYHHDSVSHALAIIEQIGRQSGAYVTMIKTDSQLITKGGVWGTGKWAPKAGSRGGGNAKNLDHFDAIFFFGLGDGNLSDQQKADLLSFIHEDGKGLVASHATTTAFANWPEWGELLGGAQAGAFSLAERSVIVEDPAFPGMDAFPKTFTFTDEFPILKAPYSRDKIHVLMRLEASKVQAAAGRGRRDDGDYPIVWAKMYGKGRVFFSGFGHPEETWDDPRVQKMYLEGIKWAMGLTNADVTPQPVSASTLAK